MLHTVYTSELTQLIPSTPCSCKTMLHLCHSLSFTYEIEYRPPKQQAASYFPPKSQPLPNSQSPKMIAVHSSSPILLSSLLLLVEGSLSKQAYNNIEAGCAQVPRTNLKQVREFLGRATFRVLRNITEDWQAGLLIQFVSKACCTQGLKLIMNMQGDLDETTRDKKAKPKVYIIAYYATMQCQQLLKKFTIQSQIINNPILKRKLQFLGLLPSSSSTCCEILRQNENMSYRLIQHEQQQQKFYSFESSVMHSQNSRSTHQHHRSSQQSNLMPTLSHPSSQHSETCILKFQYFVVYGVDMYVKKMADTLQLEIDNIGYVEFKVNDPFYNGAIFQVYLQLAQRFHKIKVFQINNGQILQVYYHVSVKGIFEGGCVDYNDYSTLKVTHQVKSVLKYSPFCELVKKWPDLVFYQDDKLGEMLAGPKNVLNQIQNAVKQRQQEKQSRNRATMQEKTKLMKNAEEETAKNMKTSTDINMNPLTNNTSNNINTQVNTNSNSPSPNTKMMKKEQKVETVVKKIQIQYLSNLQINEENYRDVFTMTESFKMQQHMNYKIDVCQYIRIINRVKKNQVVHIIFTSSHQLLRLQTILEQQIDFKSLQQLLQQYETDLNPKQYTLNTKNADTCLCLYPIPALDTVTSSMFTDILQKIKTNNQSYTKTILCSLSTLKWLLSLTKISFSLQFAIDQPFPLFELDSQLDRQTYTIRANTNKLQASYLSLVKTQVLNKDYTDSSMLRKQENRIREIIAMCRHEIEIGDFVVSQIDQYNVCEMVGRGITSMYFTLSKKPTDQFIYLTYHKKLLRLLRTKTGHFSSLQDCSFHSLPKNWQSLLKPVLTRAFLTGQRYLSISLPIDHIKQLKIQNISFLASGNENLLRYYQGEIRDSPRYRIVIREPYTVEFVNSKFPKHYTLKFENQRLRREIKEIEYGYGGIKKWRERPFLCLNAEWTVCLKILSVFQAICQQEKNQKKNNKGSTI